MKRIFTLGLVLLSAASFAQFNGPESVEYDAAGSRYLVSNTGNGTIGEMDIVTQTIGTFATGFTFGPHGLEILGDRVYACDGGRIKGFELASGSQVFDLNLNGMFLNGLTTDGTYLYATDFSAQKILKVNPVGSGSFTEFVSNTAGTPNGIVHDPAANRLVVVFWGSNAPIKAVSLSDSTVTTLTSTALGNCDGVVIDCQGNFLVSSWSPQRVSSFDPSFSNPPTDLNVSGLNNPADIDFNADANVLVVPNTGANTLSLHNVPCTFGLDDLKKNDRGIEMIFCNNPCTEELLTLKVPDGESFKGAVLSNTAGQQIRKSATNQIELNLAAGVYLLQVSTDKNLYYQRLLVTSK